MRLLSAVSISKSFNGQRVLSSVTFEIKAGEWIGVLGESGSGKSTLLNVVGRYLDADDGSVVLRGEPLPPVHTQLLPGHEDMRLVHQEYELFPNQTVRENIAYALRYHTPEYRHHRTGELLDLTQLTAVAERKAKLLSGGEKQRTALARAIAVVPALLLLDEPFAHLDHRNRQTLSEAIEQLKSARSLSCLFVTHDAGEALAWADRLMVLKEGVVIQAGTPEEVYERPASLYIAELTGRINLVRMGRGSSTYMVRPNHIRLTRKPERADWEAVITDIRFKGSFYEHYCQTTDGNELVYFRSKRDHTVGERVFLSCSKKYLRKVSD